MSWLVEGSATVPGLVLSLAEVPRGFPSPPESLLRLSLPLLLVGIFKPTFPRTSVNSFQSCSHSHCYEQPGLCTCYSINRRVPLRPHRTPYSPGTRENTPTSTTETPLLSVLYFRLARKCSFEKGSVAETFKGQKPF